MNKGLEALNDMLEYLLTYDEFNEKRHTNNAKIIETELKRLEVLNEILDSNNINSLQELKLKLSVMRSLQGLMTVKQPHPAVVSKRENADGSVEVGYTSNWSIELSKQLIKQQDEEFKKFLLQYCGYDKLTKILRIIKEKEVDTARLRYVLEHETPICFKSKLDWYNFPFDCCRPTTLTQTEFDLLKEVLL